MDTGQSDFHRPSFAPSNMLQDPVDPVISRTHRGGGREERERGEGGSVPTRRGRVKRGRRGRLEAVKDILRGYQPLHSPRGLSFPRGLAIQREARSIIDETEWRSL